MSEAEAARILAEHDAAGKAVRELKAAKDRRTRQERGHVCRVVIRVPAS